MLSQLAPARKSNLIIRLDQLQESRQDNVSSATPHMQERNGSKQGDEVASNVAQKSNNKVSKSNMLISHILPNIYPIIPLISIYF